MLRTLQLSLKWPSSLDSLTDFSLWTSKRRSINFNWIFHSIKLLRSSGLQFDFPDDVFLDLMPKEECQLANLETRSWLRSALWCLSQLFDPFHNFCYTWSDLKKLGFVPNTSKVPSWFRIIVSIPNLASLLWRLLLLLHHYLLWLENLLIKLTLPLISGIGINITGLLEWILLIPLSLDGCFIQLMTNRGLELSTSLIGFLLRMIA
jgi:hypothetical protein